MENVMLYIQPIFFLFVSTFNPFYKSKYINQYIEIKTYNILTRYKALKSTQYNFNTCTKFIPTKPNKYRVLPLFFSY